MAWQGIEGHDDVVEKLRRSLQRGRLASTFLFVGPEGIGKFRFARSFAQALLCQARDEALLDPCGQCASCKQVQAETHPDLQIVRRPPDRRFIPISAFVGEGNQRGHEGLCAHLALKPFLGGRRVAIIDDADWLNVEGANSLLKTLEEPPPRSVLILVGTSPDKQLPTIVSRCQVVRFAALDEPTMTRLLLDQRLAADPASAARLARHGRGSLARAADLAGEDLWQFRQALVQSLAQPDTQADLLARRVLDFADSAGTEATARRRRARLAVEFVMDFLRDCLRHQLDLPLQELDPQDPLHSAVAGTARRLAGDSEALSQGVQRCLDAVADLDENLNQAFVVECWAADLMRLLATAEPASAD